MLWLIKSSSSVSPIDLSVGSSQAQFEDSKFEIFGGFGWLHRREGFEVPFFLYLGLSFPVSGQTGSKLRLFGGV